MTITPASDLIARSRWAAINGKKLHLDIAHAEWIAQHPELQALLARVAAEETARLCLARKPPMDDSPPLPLFNSEPDRSPMPIVAERPERSASIPSGSISGPSGSSTKSAGMTDQHVQDAASLQALDQARMLKSRAQRDKRLRHTSPPPPVHRPRKPPLQLVSLPS